MDHKVDKNISDNSVSPEIASLRQEYVQNHLRREDLLPHPVAMFRQWFEDARRAELLEPNAMTLATANLAGKVTARTVLLKAYDERGFVFFTNYGSRKALQIAENPQSALLFPWLALERQVEITGRAEKISSAESLAYFLSRPLGSRIGAWVSDQSKVVSSRGLLENKFHSLMEKFSQGEVPKPEWWGGIRVIPETVEFWQGGRNRIHDRFLYTKISHENWTIERLQP